MKRVSSSSRFEKIKRLKERGKSSKEIASTLRIRNNYVNLVFNVINAGCSSFIEYKKRIIQDKINPETGKPFSNIKEYDDYRARQRGYEGRINYIRIRNVLAEEDSSSPNQRIFERTILVKDPKDLETIVDNTQLSDEQRRTVAEYIIRLPMRQRRILEQRFYNNRKLKDVGGDFEISRERTRQLQERAIASIKKKLFPAHHKPEEIYEGRKPIEDGEILLIYRLSRSKEYQVNGAPDIDKIRNYVNKNYHDGLVRSSASINCIRSKAHYKARLEAIIERYRPILRRFS